MKILGIFIAVLCFTTHAAADGVYKCEVGGKTVYQESACSGTELKGDTPWDRERARKVAEQKAYEARLVKEKAELQNQISDLRTCKSPDSNCAAAYFTGYVRGLTQSELVQALGEPANTQNIGREVFWYYDLFLVDGSKVRQRRVQITFIGKTVDRANTY